MRSTCQGILRLPAVSQGGTSGVRLLWPGMHPPLHWTCMYPPPHSISHSSLARYASSSSYDMHVSSSYDVTSCLPYTQAPHMPCMFIARTIRFCRAPKITVMSSLPQAFTEPFGSFFLLSLTKRSTKRLSTIVVETNQTVRFVKTCGKFDISAIFWARQNRRVLAINVSSSSYDVTSSLPRLLHSSSCRKKFRSPSRAISVFLLSVT